MVKKYCKVIKKTIHFINKLTTNCMYAGVNLIPSTNRATGASRKNDMIVIIEKRVMSSRDSCFIKEITGQDKKLQNRGIQY